MASTEHESRSGAAAPSAPSAPSTPSALPPGRYGRSAGAENRHRRALRVTFGLFVVLVLCWAAWATWSRAADRVTWSITEFTALDAGRSDVTFTVTVQPGRSAVCTVDAVNAASATVGRRDVLVGPSARETFSVTARLATTEPAVGGVVRGCAAG